MNALRADVDTGAYLEAARKTLAETGELLPGVEIAPERESFSVRFGKAGVSDTPEEAAE